MKLNTEKQTSLYAISLQLTNVNGLKMVAHTKVVSKQYNTKVNCSRS